MAVLWTSLQFIDISTVKLYLNVLCNCTGGDYWNELCTVCSFVHSIGDYLCSTSSLLQFVQISLCPFWCPCTQRITVFVVLDDIVCHPLFQHYSILWPAVEKAIQRLSWKAEGQLSSKARNRTNTGQLLVRVYALSTFDWLYNSLWGIVIISILMFVHSLQNT